MKFLGIKQKLFFTWAHSGLEEKLVLNVSRKSHLGFSSLRSWKIVKINPHCYNPVGFNTIKQQQAHANYSQSTAVREQQEYNMLTVLS